MKASFLSSLYQWDEKLVKLISQLLHNYAADLYLRIENIKLLPGILEITYSGEDKEIFTHQLKKIFGEAHRNLGQLKRLQILKGVIVGNSKKGILVDLGVRQPDKIYAVLPRKKANNQLSDGKNFTVNELIERFCLIPFTSLEIILLSLEPRLVVELTNKQVKHFWRWDSSPFPKIVISGLFRNELEKKLKRIKLDNLVVELTSSTILTHILTIRLCEDLNKIVRTWQSIDNDCKLAVYRPNTSRFGSGYPSMIEL